MEQHALESALAHPLRDEATQDMRWQKEQHQLHEWRDGDEKNCVGHLVKET